MNLIREIGPINDSFDKRTYKWYSHDYGIFECPKCLKQYTVRMDRGFQRKCCKDCAPKERQKHGQASGGKPTRLYSIWLQMKQRCSNPNSCNWSNYGAKGIKVCEKWQSFEGFFEDNKDRYKNKLTLDRIDSNGDYCLENTQWITKEENSAKTSRVRKVDMLTKEGIFIRTWDSARQAALALHIASAHISACCSKNGHRVTAGGFRWKYTPKPIDNETSI